MATGCAGWGVVLVTSGFLLNMLISGVHSALGVIYVHWLQEFGAGKGVTSSVVSVRLALMNILGPVTSYLMDEFGGGPVSIVGGGLIFIGYAISFSAQSIDVLVITVGVIGGFGCSFVSLPCTSIIAKYFTENRGAAIGLTTSGAGFGALVFPHLFTYLEVEYGWRGTLLITSALTLNLCACGMVFGITELKTHSAMQRHVDNNNISEHNVEKRTENIFQRLKSTFRNLATIIDDHTLLICLLSNTLTTASYFVPLLYIVDRALSFGISLPEGSLLISAYGIGSLIGRISSGVMVDRQLMDIILLYIGVLVTFGTSTCISVLCKGSYIAHMSFAAIAGTTAGSWSTLVTPLIVELAGVERIAPVFSVFMLCMGVSVAVGPPLAGWLVDITGDYLLAFLLHGANLVASGLIMVPIALRRYRAINVESGYSMDEHVRSVMNSRRPNELSISCQQSGCHSLDHDSTMMYDRRVLFFELNSHV